MRPRQLVAVVLVLVSVALAAALLMSRWLREPAGVSSAPAIAARPDPVPGRSARSVVPTARVAPVQSAVCRAQTLDVVDPLPARYCVSGPLTEQNGSLRSYIVDLDDGSASLRIDAAGQTVMAVSLRGGLGNFACTESECAGARVSERDDQGRRTVILNAAALHPLASDATGRTIRVSGRYVAVPEEQIAGVACTHYQVVITRENGSHSSFCARDGAGFEIADDGDRTYRFTSLEGDSILVKVDPNENLRGVEYLDTVAHECQPPGCGVVSLSPAEESGERRFAFHGVTVTEKEGSRTALLDGILILPPT